MNTTNTGGFAFPVASAGGSRINEGMSLRDYFAGQALAGVGANPASGCNSPADLAHWAYQCADAMLRERAK